MALSFLLLLLLYAVKVRSDDNNTSIKSVSDGDSGDNDDNDSRYKESNWGYLEDPSEWCIQYEKCCGDAQSPIDFDTRSALKERFPKITLTNYDSKPKELLLKNNGHTVIVYPKYDGETPAISDGGLGGKYEFAAFHFHWGSNNEQGAEHTVDGLAYPLELHLVHFNTKYGSLERAVENTDGIAVLGIFYKLGQFNNDALDDVVDNLDKIKYLDQSVNFTNVRLKLSHLIPSSIDEFFRYVGSLTTPKCQESVTWTVFENIQVFTIFQLDKFRELFANVEDSRTTVALVDNFRPIQHLRGRKVHRRSISGSRSLVNHHSQLILLITGVIIPYLR